MKLRLKSPPFSINTSHYIRTKTRTKECRDWGDKILLQLQKQIIQIAFGCLRKNFDETKHGIIFEITWYHPRKKFFTQKDGSVSRRTKDLSNIEKLLIDLICDKRFNGRVFKVGKIPKIIKNLNIDDQYIVDLISKKRPHDKTFCEIEVGIDLIDLSEL